MILEELLNMCTVESVVDIVISGQRNKTSDISKIKLRPVKLKGKLMFQASEYVGTKVIHNNMTKAELDEYIKTNMLNSFKQGQFVLVDGTGVVLCNNKGSMTVKYKKSECLREQKTLEHNKKKKYILEEGKKVDFLVDLGVMTKEGKIVASKYDKFRQINRFLEFIEDIIPKLDSDREQTIIDFGCGKSYLTFAMYYYLKELKGLDIKIIGLDLKTDVIMHCNMLSRKYGYNKLRFYQGDIASYKDVDHVDMVVTLHACDTATDYALAKAINWGAKVILSVPCCQHEANNQIEAKELEPVLKYGILKERMSAIFTDAIRANLLEEAGYQTQILEFIDMEHTPKNLLIRAVYTGKKIQNTSLKNMEDMLNLKLTLNRLLEEGNE